MRVADFGDGDSRPIRRRRESRHRRRIPPRRPGRCRSAVCAVDRCGRRRSPAGRRPDGRTPPGWRRSPPAPWPGFPCPAIAHGRPAYVRLDGLKVVGSRPARRARPEADMPFSAAKRVQRAPDIVVLHRAASMLGRVHRFKCEPAHEDSVCPRPEPTLGCSRCVLLALWLKSAWSRIDARDRPDEQRTFVVRTEGAVAPDHDQGTQATESLSRKIFLDASSSASVTFRLNTAARYNIPQRSRNIVDGLLPYRTKDAHGLHRCATSRSSPMPTASPSGSTRRAATPGRRGPAAGFFDDAGDMLAGGDMLMVSARDGGRMLSSPGRCRGSYAPATR